MSWICFYGANPSSSQTQRCFFLTWWLFTRLFARSLQAQGLAARHMEPEALVFKHGGVRGGGGSAQKTVKGFPPAHPLWVEAACRATCICTVALIMCCLKRQALYGANPSSSQTQRCFFLTWWLFTRSLPPSLSNLVMRWSRKVVASTDTLTALWKNSVLMSFLDGGSAILLFDGTRAIQVKEWIYASISAK